MPALEAGLNPATWMLQVSTPGMESTIGVDFGQIYRDSSLHEYALDISSDLCKTASILQPLPMLGRPGPLGTGVSRSDESV